MLRISARRVNRVKKRFVEDGLEAALGNRQGRRAKYHRKADGEFEARLVAPSCGDPPEGRAKWSLRLLADRAVGARLHRQRVARYGAAGAKKEERTPGPSNRSCPSWSVRRDPVPAPHGPGTGSPRTSCSRVRPRKRRAATPPSPEQGWPADQPPWRPAPRCPTLPPDIPGPLSPEHER